MFDYDVKTARPYEIVTNKQQMWKRHRDGHSFDKPALTPQRCFPGFFLFLKESFLLPLKISSHFLSPS